MVAATLEASANLAYRRYVLVMLTAVYMFNLVDRGLMMLLLQPIKEDLQLSDTQLGLLTGIAFGLFYATLGVPIARWADRGDRVTITSLSIGLWAVTVMLCVFVGNFIQLMLARVAAGIGEAGGKPPTYSLVGDYFPEAVERTRAMSVYWLSSPLAGLVSFIVGGWLCDRYGWRMTFLILGIPGLLLALLVKLTINEPRTALAPARGAQARTPPLKTVMRVLWQRRSCRFLSIALILYYTMGLGMSPWYAAFLMRSHGMGTVELGVWLGVIFAGGGIVGVLLGGHVAARWFGDDERGQMRATASAVALLVPCFIAFLTVPQKHQALIAFVPLTVVFNFFLAPTYALMQRLVADDMRATMMALVMLLANLIGMGIGPQIVGVLSDALAPRLGIEALRYAMLAMSLVAAVSAYFFWKVASTVKEDLSTIARCPPSLG